MLYSSSLQGLKQALGPFAGVYSADEEASYEALMEKAKPSASASAAAGGNGGGVSKRLRSMQQWGGGVAGGGAIKEDAPLTELEKVLTGFVFTWPLWHHHPFLTLASVFSPTYNSQLKLAERHMEVDNRVRLPGLKAGAPFTLHDDARVALQTLAAAAAGDGMVNWLELSVEPEGKQVLLSGAKAAPALIALEQQDAGQLESEIAPLIAPVGGLIGGVSVPCVRTLHHRNLSARSTLDVHQQAEPRFFVIATRSRTLHFIYFCPAEAPIRLKMSYSVQKKTTVEKAEAALGRPFDAVVEAQELGDVAAALLSPAAGVGEGDEPPAEAPVTTTTTAATAATATARPRAPGRRGASTRVKLLMGKEEDEEDGEG